MDKGRGLEVLRLFGFSSKIDRLPVRTVRPLGSIGGKPLLKEVELVEGDIGVGRGGKVAVSELASISSMSEIGISFISLDIDSRSEVVVVTGDLVETDCCCCLLSS